MSAMSAEPADEFVRGPKWRTRTTPRRRHLAAAVTLGVIVIVGVVAMWACAWSLAWLGATGSVLTLVWAVPTACVVLWTLVRPTVAELTDDDDDSWFGYTIRWALVGEIDCRPAPVRVLVAVVLGAPVGWALVVFALLTVSGIL